MLGRWVFIKVSSLRQDDPDWLTERWYFKLTEKAKPYIAQEFNDGSVAVVVRRPLSLTVTGMTVPAEEGGQKVIFVDWIVEYELTPFAQFVGPGKGTQEKGRSKLVLYDDGWR